MIIIHYISFLFHDLISPSSVISFSSSFLFIFHCFMYIIPLYVSLAWFISSITLISSLLTTCFTSDNYSCKFFDTEFPKQTFYAFQDLQIIEKSVVSIFSSVIRHKFSKSNMGLFILLKAYKNLDDSLGEFLIFLRLKITVFMAR